MCLEQRRVPVVGKAFGGVDDVTFATRQPSMRRVCLTVVVNKSTHPFFCASRTWSKSINETDLLGLHLRKAESDRVDSVSCGSSFSILNFSLVGVCLSIGCFWYVGGYDTEVCTYLQLASSFGIVRLGLCSRVRCMLTKAKNLYQKLRRPCSTTNSILDRVAGVSVSWRLSVVCSIASKRFGENVITAFLWQFISMLIPFSRHPLICFGDCFALLATLSWFMPYTYSNLPRWFHGTSKLGTQVSAWMKGM